MSISTITTVLIEPDRVADQLQAATDAARMLDAHLHILGLALGLDQSVLSQSALETMFAGTGMEEAISRVKELVETARAQLSEEDIRWNMDATTVPAAAFAAEIARHARFSDQVIHQRGPQDAGDPQSSMLAEAVLFDADCPLLILPRKGTMPQPTAPAMIAWDGSAAALRAVRQALPILRQSEAVHVMMIAPDGSEKPGQDLARFLSRQDVHCELAVSEKGGEPIAKTLERRAQERGCALLVMGAYGHSRLRQAIFGGTTREVLNHLSMPVLMHH